MPIDFRCPYCGNELSAPEAAAGTTGTCRFCGATLTSPTETGGIAVLVAAGNQNAAPPRESGPYAPPPIGTTMMPGSLDPAAIVGEAWRFITANWTVLVASLFIIAFVELLVLGPVMYYSFGPVFLKALKEASAGGSGRMTGFNPIAMPAKDMVVANLLAWVASAAVSPLALGPLYVIDRIMVRGDASFGALFQGFRHYKDVVTYTVLFSLPSLFCTLLQSAFANTSPGLAQLCQLAGGAATIALWVTLGPGRMEIVDRGTSALEAFRWSWEATKGRRVEIFVVGILLTVCYALGILACCIGVLLTVNFFFVGEVLVYRQLRGLQGTPD